VGSIVLAVTSGLIVAAIARPPAAFAGGATVTGTGSSYAAVAINQWVNEAASLYGDNINYATTSSVIGLNDFASGQVDLGASEIGYSTGQANASPHPGYSYQYLPDVAGATCLMYNLTNQLSSPITDLKLNPQVLLGMFSGAITNWNDPAIKALNPNTLLPTTPIVLVYRTDASGDNYIFSDYLNTIEPSGWSAFTSALNSPPGAQAIWPVPQNGARTVGPYSFGNWNGQNGSDNASNYVYGNQNSITYVETAYAILHHDPCAFVQNASGNYVQPSELADAIALQSDQLQPDLEQNLTGVFETTAPTAYSISAYSYLISGENPPAAGSSEIASDKASVIAQFIQFIACKGQQSAAQLGYSPIPTNLVQADFDAVQRITGVALPAPTAANCDNPYLTGQLQAVAGPTISQTPTGAGTAGASASPVAASAANAAAAAAAAKGGATATKGSSTAAASSSGTVGSSATASGKKAHTHRKGLEAAPPSGQFAGVAFHGATADLLRSHTSSLGPLLAALVFLAIIALPPAIAMSRRRQAPEPESGDGKP
jgi:phosphate ABC transporter phosphate-binding protein